MMHTRDETVALGLADVVAVETRLSRVDGDNGELVIAGRSIDELAFASTFEQLSELLWDTSEAQGLEAQSILASARYRALERVSLLPSMPNPMDAIRLAVAAIPTSGDLLTDAYEATATIPVAIGSWWAERSGASIDAAGSEVGHVEAYLCMLGIEPTEPKIQALTRYLVTVSDHGMNASTFTARVITSTRSDLISAITGAVGALKGPLHGGAPGPVLDMLDEIGSAEHAEEWLVGELDAGRRIMGMGHRVYRVRDPRASVFERALTELTRGRASSRLDLARAVERAATEELAKRYPDRDLRANVEFYTAVLLEALGIPRELFSATFAIGRVLGWCAHVMEQAKEDRLIRPRSRYIGR